MYRDNDMPAIATVPWHRFWTVLAVVGLLGVLVAWFARWSYFAGRRSSNNTTYYSHANWSPEYLIRQLRSSNHDPNPKGDPFVSWPEDYDFDFESARKVETARIQLIILGKDAFPMLIDSMNEEEYSLSWETYLSSQNTTLVSYSVGDVCFMCIEAQVGYNGPKYTSRKGSDGEDHVYRGYFSQYCGGRRYTQDGLRKWWKEHQHKSSLEIKTEALQWAIQRERDIGFPGETDKKIYLDPLLHYIDSLRRYPAAYSR